ncbi:addiction module protein [Desulfovibrio sp. JC022]|uniref:addiction module protein n=1 Tax=Desulfovibrio sp. JC022 TaxID=2593642 RepID=UPI0013D6F671|nr:addiction module protein [Desulfovibrio sp. JC022]NDV23934.1 addiction module protein [Desulfovibrio sp. JC022]
MIDLTTITDQALQLAPVQRAELIEALLASFDSRRKSIDSKWAVEAESRIDAYEQGKIDSVSADEVFDRIGRQE